MNCPLMLDDRLIDIKSVSSKTYKKLGLKYYIAPDMEYIVDELLEVQPNEVQSYRNAANELYQLLALSKTKISRQVLTSHIITSSL